MSKAKFRGTVSSNQSYSLTILQSVYSKVLTLTSMTAFITMPAPLTIAMDGC